MYELNNSTVFSFDLGESCERRIDYCSQDKPYCGNGKCQNHYSDSKNKAVCVCDAGYTEANCTIDINECQLGYCQNNISCVNYIGSYNCGCMPGFSGRNCSMNIDECASSPCRHGGTCHDEVNRYTCTCKYGFSGSNCENDANWCSTTPCQNGGNCTDVVESYNCSCYEGFHGKNCEVDVNECDSNPCQDGSTCIERSKIASNFAALGENNSISANSYGNRYVVD